MNLIKYGWKQTRIIVCFIHMHSHENNNQFGQSVISWRQIGVIYIVTGKDDAPLLSRMNSYNYKSFPCSLTPALYNVATLPLLLTVALSLWDFSVLCWLDVVTILTVLLVWCVVVVVYWLDLCGVIAMRQQQHNCTNSHFAELHLMTVVFEVM